MLMLWTALVLGLTGSLHCVGMCGPLVLALPGQRRWDVFLSRRLVYHGGRLLGYALLGVPAGLVGQSLSLLGWQRSLSIALGVLLVLGALSSRLRRSGPGWLQSLAAWPERIVLKFGHRFRTAQGYRDFLITGILNGWLPCGLVYTALAGAAASGTVLQAVAYMAVFGLGTIPLLLITMFAGRLIGRSWQNVFQRLAPWAVGLLGVLLILRGLGLGIPFISPPAHLPHHQGLMV